MNIYYTIIKNEFPIKSTAFEYIYRIIVAFIAIRFGHHYPSHDSLRLPSGLVARSPRCNLASRRLSDGRDFSTYPRLQIAFCTGVARLCARGPTVQRRIQRPHYVPVSCIRRQQRRVVGTRTRGPVYVSHGCTHPCIQAAIRRGFRPGLQWVSKTDLLSCVRDRFRIRYLLLPCCTPSSRAAGCATIEPR